jgi:Ferritin-like domain
VTEHTPTPAHGAGPQALTIADVDRDGALSEALDATLGADRAHFLRVAALGSAALIGGLAAPDDAFAARSPKLDTKILNFGLVFEYLQATFYTQADQLGTVAAMGQPREKWARVLGAHERAHVQILKRVLGSKAVKKPFFNYHGVTDDPDAFTRTAVAMEDLTVALLAGQTPRMSNEGLVAALFSLLTVEARHAAWARHIVRAKPVRAPFDRTKTLDQVSRVIRSTRFLASQPKTAKKRGRPKFTG